MQHAQAYGLKLANAFNTCTHSHTYSHIHLFTNMKFPSYTCHTNQTDRTIESVLAVRTFGVGDCSYVYMCMCYKVVLQHALKFTYSQKLLDVKHTLEPRSVY